MFSLLFLVPIMEGRRRGQALCWQPGLSLQSSSMAGPRGSEAPHWEESGLL